MGKSIAKHHLLGIAAMTVAMGAYLVTPAYAQTETSSANTLYVSTTGNDLTGQGTSANPYQTLTFAVSQATPGATIIVEPGVYRESVQIDKQVTIESDASATNAVQSTVLDAKGQNDAIDISGMASAGTVIEGLTIEHANNKAIWAQDSAHLWIGNNVITDNGLAPNKNIPENKPIQFDGVSDSVISGNTISGNQEDGAISVTDNGMMNPGAPMAAPAAGGSGSGSSTAPAVPAVPAVGNVIADNTLTGNLNGCAIVIGAFNPGGGLFDTEVIGNTVSGSPLGIDVGTGFIPGTKAMNNVILDNTVTNNLGVGILVHSTNKGDILSGTVVSGNTVSGNGPFIDRGKTIIAKATGIALVGENVPVLQTTVTDNSISNEAFGIYGANAVGTALGGNTHGSGVTAPLYGLSNEVDVALNGTVVRQLPAIDANGTTYVAIWYVMQMLKQLGVASTWNGHSWSLTAPSVTAHSGHAVGNGPVSIALNHILIGHSTPMYAVDSSGQYTTYLPMSSIAAMATALGIHNSWDGTTWAITATHV